MKRLVSIGISFLFVITLALAHGNEQHVMGTVSDVTDNSITVETKEHQKVTVSVDAETKFIRGTSPSTLKDVKVGDRVVIHAVKEQNRLRAHTVQIGGAKPPAGHSGHHESGMHMSMGGSLGSYPMTRESSGTSWQPDSSQHQGLHLMKDDWMLMLHGFAQVVYDDQRGPRGASKTYSANMVRFMGTHRLGEGTFTFRTMVSADPLTIGRNGYPLLLQSGETADGKTPLIDRQHPHDLFMEMAVSYSRPVSESTSVFVYFGLPGEPALGPPVYMHRFSGEEIPAAPITHHWLDSTHISYGVVTGGLTRKNFKLEGSWFNGREPDQYRYDFDPPRFDSYAFRVTYNLAPNWSFQGSWGDLHSPEQLEPNVNQERATASAIYNRSWNGNQWQTTLAWGRNLNEPGHALNGVLLESTINLHDAHTVFGRLERVAKDELFEPGQPLAGTVFTVGEGSLGYIYDFYHGVHLKAGLGAMGSVDVVPGSLKRSYGDSPLSALLFLRFKLK